MTNYEKLTKRLLKPYRPVADVRCSLARRVSVNSAG
jgi:hypothetical protein